MRCPFLIVQSPQGEPASCRAGGLVPATLHPLWHWDFSGRPQWLQATRCRRCLVVGNLRVKLRDGFQSAFIIQRVWGAGRPEYDQTSKWDTVQSGKVFWFGMCNLNMLWWSPWATWWSWRFWELWTIYCHSQTVSQMPRYKGTKVTCINCMSQWLYWFCGKRSCPISEYPFFLLHKTDLWTNKSLGCLQ